MRAVVVSAWEPWRVSDGAVWILHHHLRELAARHDITVLAAGAPAREAPLPDGARTLPDRVAVRWFGASTSPGRDFARRRISAWRTGEPTHVSYVERPALLAAVRAELARGADVVHAFGWGTAALWRHCGGTPFVHMPVDAWHRNLDNRVLPAWRRVVDVGEAGRVSAHERRHYPHAAAVVVVADRDADALRALVPTARVEVVPNGVDAGAEPSPLPSSGSVLAFHGSFDARHNVDAARVLVRQVLPLVRRHVPDASVLLVGRRAGPDVRGLAGATVELRHDVADPRVELADASVYVAPLVSGWGLKNKVLEAMAVGRAVVTTPLGSAGIGAGPGLVEAADPAAVAEQVVALLADRTRLAAQGAAGRRRVQHDFTWAASAARIEALWREAQR